MVSDFHFEMPSYRLTDKEGDLVVARNKTQLAQCLEIGKWKPVQRLEVSTFLP